MFSMKKLFTLVSVVAICAEVAMAQLPNGAPPTTLFQLNGFVGSSDRPGSDKIADPAAPFTCTYRDANGNPVPNQECDNWNLLNGPPKNAGHSDEQSFVDGSLQNFLFKRGTKDIEDISTWHFSPDQKAPPKDTFNFGYSAGYTAPNTFNNDFVLIFGGDRSAPNGDANIGMWLLQATVIPCVSGGISAITGNADPNCASIPAGSFSGQHFDHDIFVTSAFTNGGTAPFLTIYEWDHGCGSLNTAAKNPKIGDCADTNLRLLGTAANPNSLCDGNSGCGVINSATTHSSWEGAIASPLYFGGGVDVSAALAVAGVSHAPCFASFELETRASQSSGAELKDFIVGGFPECAVTVTKACLPPPSIVFSSAGIASVHYTFAGNVTNAGGGGLFSLNVVDTFPVNSVNKVLNQPVTPANGLGQGQSASYSGSFDFPNLSEVTNHVAASAAASDGGPNTITADKNGNPAVADAKFGSTASACHIDVNPTLTLAKTCQVGLNSTSNGVVLALNDTITVCNTSRDTSINNINLTNNVLLNGPNSGADFSVDSNRTLAAGECKTFTPSYIPTQCDSGPATLDGGRCEFTDTVRVSSIPKDEFGRDVPAGVIPSPKQASCHVCPFGACTLSGTP